MRLTKRTLLSISRLASDVLSKVPERRDSLLTVAVKLCAMVESVDKIYGGRVNTFRDMHDRHDLVERRNAPFVQLFFQTAMHSNYTLHRIEVDEHTELIQATNASGGLLIFQECRWGGRPEISPVFFSTTTFDFKEAMELLWATYPNGLYLTMSEGRNGEQESAFQELPWKAPVVMSTKGERKIAEVISRHLAARARGKHRSYIVVGPPGTGKSHLAVRMAQANGGRLLNVDSSSLTKINGQELGFLLEILAPNFLVLDDFDELPIDGTKARVRALFAHLKIAHSGCSIVVTVNDPKKVDHALLRGERIDIPIDFELPDVAERIDLLEKLFAHYDIKRVMKAPYGPKSPIADTGIDLEYLVKRTEGFNHSDIASLCGRLLDEPLIDVVTSALRLRELAAAAMPAMGGLSAAPGSAVPVAKALG